MANAKLTSLIGVSSPVSSDLFYLVRTTDTTDDPTGSSRAIAFSSLTVGLANSGANSDITSLSALSTPLSVAQGGSGAATLTGILKGNGTSAFTAVTAPSGAIVGTTDVQVLTNKLLSDSTTSIIDVSDATKILKFDVAGTTGVTGTITSAFTATRTLALPDATDTLVGKATTDTLTNKTLTSPAINTPTFSTGAITTAAILDANVTSRKVKMDKLQSATSTSNVNTTSSSYVDYTGLTVTFTPDVASNFLVLFQSNYSVNAQGIVSFVVNLDGSTSGNDPLASNRADNGGFEMNSSGSLWITGVSQASHTVKVQVKTSAGTLTTTYGSLTVIPFAS